MSLFYYSFPNKRTCVCFEISKYFAHNNICLPVKNMKDQNTK